MYLRLKNLVPELGTTRIWDVLYQYLIQGTVLAGGTPAFLQNT